MKKVVIILQARTGSARLPKKVLLPTQDIPILSHCIRRLKKINNDVPVIVATSVLKQDDAVVDLARKEGVDYYRGSENDVLDRYYKVARKYKAMYIIRATGDNPFVDVSEGKRLLNEIVSGKWDYVNMIEKVNGKRLPLGVGLEAFTFDALLKSWEKGLKTHHREHVNEYIFENINDFNIHFMSSMPENSCPDLSLSIDTPEDLQFIFELTRKLDKPLQAITTKDLIRCWKKLCSLQRK